MNILFLSCHIFSVDVVDVVDVVGVVKKNINFITNLVLNILAINFKPKSVVLFLSAKDDKNGALHIPNLRNTYHLLSGDQVKIVRRTVSSISDIKTVVNQSCVNYGQEKIKAVWINAHGDSNCIYLSNDYGTDLWIHTGLKNLKNGKCHDSNVDELGKALDVLKNAVVVIDACETAQNEEKSVAGKIAEVTNKQVYAATASIPYSAASCSWIKSAESLDEKLEASFHIPFKGERVDGWKTLVNLVKSIMFQYFIFSGYNVTKKFTPANP